MHAAGIIKLNYGVATQEGGGEIFFSLTTAGHQGVSIFTYTKS